VPVPIAVDDPGDPRLGDYIGLTDATLRRQVEGTRGLFIAEGELVIHQLLASAYPVRSILLSPPRYERLKDALATVTAPVYVAAPSVLAAVTGFDIHRGAVAAADRLPAPELGPLLATARRLAILEGLNDHENLGALFRNAAALGVDGVLLSPTCADPLYRRSVRVSLGHVLRVPFAQLAPWPAALADLAAAGWDVVALSPRPGTESVTSIDPSAPRVAVLLGAEGSGLTGPALRAATRVVHIPMRPGVDSLNVATAAAIAFHHLWPE